MVSKNTLIVCLVMLASAVAEPASAQCPTDPNALLNELRSLRQAVEALATTGVRMQIVFGRLQLQEQRTNSAAERHDAIRERLIDISDMITNVNESLKRYEETASSARDLKQQELATTMIQTTKLHLTSLEADRARVIVEELDAAGRLAYEQARWSELNSILDELERTLVRRPR